RPRPMLRPHATQPGRDTTAPRIRPRTRHRLQPAPPGTGRHTRRMVGPGRNRTMNNYDVAIPVTVQIRAGQVIGAHVDFEGAPWPLTDSEPNVWNVDTEEWEQNHDLED